MWSWLAAEHWADDLRSFGPRPSTGGSSWKGGMGLNFSVSKLLGCWWHRLSSCDLSFLFFGNPGAHNGEGQFFDIFSSTLYGWDIFWTFLSGDLSRPITVGHFFDIFPWAPKPSHIFDIFKTFFWHFQRLKMSRNVWLVALASRLVNSSLAKCPGAIWPASGSEGKCPGDFRRRALLVTVSASCLRLPSVVQVRPLASLPSLILLRPYAC